MACICCTACTALVVFALLSPVLSAISVPPLQWLNITRLLSGPSAPPLKGASIGYDDTTRSLLIFGGESEGGFPQSNTYLLNMDSLIWTIPVPPTGLGNSPPSRSNAMSGSDMAASNRHGHVVIGGKGAGGKALSDIWEYDYISQFWSNVNLSPGGPSARWGASGGIDPRISFIPLTGLNNSFYLAGGYDGTTAYPLSDLWRLNISGTLSSNLPNSVYASWESLSANSLPLVVEQAGAIISETVVAVGGCNTTDISDDSCAQGNSYVIDAANGGSISPQPCPAPRIEATLTPNLNGVSSSFTSQMLLLLGTYNTSLWQDDNGLESGEVAILDIGTGTWIRTIPAGDPESTSPYPSPRSGAAALTYSDALIGSSRSSAADTIVFGGQDANGSYLSEMWILRAYNGTVSQSNPRWDGYGNGQLTSGANADGSGVTMTFLTTCAKSISPSGGPSGSSSSSPMPTTSGTSLSYPYDTHSTHKLLAPLSIVVLLPAIILYRLSSPSILPTEHSSRRAGLFYSSVFVAIASYGIGIGGLATSFTSLISMPAVGKRSDTSLYLRTGHGRVGLALFIAFYGFVPTLALSLVLVKWFLDRPSMNEEDTADNSDVSEGEKRERSPAPSALNQSAPETPVGRTGSSSRLALWSGFRTRDARTSNESIKESLGSSSGPSRSFEVTNRLKRTRHASGNSLNVSGGTIGNHHSSMAPRILADISWLDRRRGLNAVGDLDYALSQLNREQAPSTRATLEATSLMGPSRSQDSHPEFPNPLESCLHALFHLLLLGLCILSLVELWARAPIATFVAFLVWTVAFYLLMIILAWNGRPRKSILAVVFSRLRTTPQQDHRATPPSRPLSDVGPTDSEARGPYLHQPPFRAVFAAGVDDDFASNSARPFDTEEEENEEDEAMQQRRMEDEMNRRDVSIVTVPRRKLWITNLS